MFYISVPLVYHQIPRFFPKHSHIVIMQFSCVTNSHGYYIVFPLFLTIDHRFPAGKPTPARPGDAASADSRGLRIWQVDAHTALAGEVRNGEDHPRNSQKG